ncbi:MAG: ATP-binding protein [Chloroflexota bacterium]|nr:ATP-binding protein [Chloroflexota bacterium]
MPATGWIPTVGEAMRERQPNFLARADSIRARTTVLAIVLVGVALIVGAVALVTVMRGALTESVLADARLRASDVAAELRGGTAPSELTLPSSDDVLIQVLDADDRVLAASAETPGTALATDLASGEAATINVAGDDDPFLIVSVAAQGPSGARTVIVARVLDLVEESTEVVTTLLMAGLPILLVLVGVVAWLLVGRSLAPVEAIRREVEEISGTQLHRRVPVPRGTDEIAGLAVTMNEMLARLERASDRQRQLVADTSHELRSPIASIRQHAEVAAAYPERTNTSELAGTVLAESLRLARLVDDLLLLARADERNLQLKQRPLDLDDLEMEAARALRREGTIAVDSTGVSGGRVRGDADGLRRVVANLAENAARHARSRVAISVLEERGTVLLRVDDDGPGIAPADRGRVFERFVRLDAARARDAGGSGLGLAIVAELVAAHGGTVVVSDSPLGGSRIEVRLARASDV